MKTTANSVGQVQAHQGRRHSDPPGLWLAVLAGSVTCHCLLLLVLYANRGQIGVATSTADSIPVELIEVAPTAAPVTRSPAPPSLPVAAPQAIAPDPVPLDPTTPTVLPSTPPVRVPPPSPRPSPITPASPSPVSSSPTPPVTPTPPASSPPVSSSPPSPVSASPTPPVSPTPTPPVSSLSPSPPTGPITSGEQLPSVPSVTPVQPVVPPSSPDRPLPPGTPVAVNPDPDSVAVGQLQISLPQQPQVFTAGGDIPQVAAVPRTVNQTLKLDEVSDRCQISTTQVTTDSRPYWGKTVRLRITVNDTGQVVADQTAIEQSADQGGTYDQLAKCLVNRWEFTPATNEDSPVWSNLRIWVSLDRL